MSFLVVLIAIGIERYFSVEFLLRREKVFAHYFVYVGKLIPLKWQTQHYGIFLMVLPAVLGVMTFQLISNYWFPSALIFLLELLLLLYCLGPNSIYHSIDAHPSNLFEQMHSSLFTALFWFILLGPSGVVLFRLIEQLATMPMHRCPDNLSENIQIMAVPLVGCLSWLPIRFFIGIQSILGQFPDTMRYWLDHLLTDWSYNPVLASDSGRIAVNMAIEEESLQRQRVLQLMDQTLLVFLGMLLLYTLLSLVI